MAASAGRRDEAPSHTLSFTEIRRSGAHIDQSQPRPKITAFLDHDHTTPLFFVRPQQTHSHPPGRSVAEPRYWIRTAPLVLCARRGSHYHTLRASASPPPHTSHLQAPPPASMRSPVLPAGSPNPAKDGYCALSRNVSTDADMCNVKRKGACPAAANGNPAFGCPLRKGHYYVCVSYIRARILRRLHQNGC